MQFQQGVLGIHPYYLGPEPQSFGHDYPSKIDLWQCHIPRNIHHDMLDHLEHKKQHHL
jgi:hypothetical protein